MRFILNELLSLLLGVAGIWTLWNTNKFAHKMQDYYIRQFKMIPLIGRPYVWAWESWFGRIFSILSILFVGIWLLIAAGVGFYGHFF
jgi:hypothetical protein